MNLSNIDISNINPIQNGLFRGCSRIRGRGGGGSGFGGRKAPAPKNLSHMSYNDETWHSYTLPKKDP